MLDTHAPDRPAEEEQRPNLCPVCNGQGWHYRPLIALHVYTEPYEDCAACLGDGVITRPYTGQDIWHDALLADVHRYRTAAELAHA